MPCARGSGGRPLEALQETARQWSGPRGEGRTGRHRLEPVDLQPEVERRCLWTAQEALANVAKHAGASRAGLTLSYMRDMVVLDIRDDGGGFDPSALRTNGDHGFGLASMRQRMSQVAGSLEIETEVGSGTAISARVPLHAQRQEGTGR